MSDYQCCSLLCKARRAILGGYGRPWYWMQCYQNVAYFCCLFYNCKTFKDTPERNHRYSLLDGEMIIDMDPHPQERKKIPHLGLERNQKSVIRGIYIIWQLLLGWSINYIFEAKIYFILFLSRSAHLNDKNTVLSGGIIWSDFGGEEIFSLGNVLNS